MGIINYKILACAVVILTALVNYIFIVFADRIVEDKRITLTIFVINTLLLFISIVSLINELI